MRRIWWTWREREFGVKSVSEKNDKLNLFDKLNFFQKLAWTFSKLNFYLFCTHFKLLLLEFLEIELLLLFPSKNPKLFFTFTTAELFRRSKAAFICLLADRWTTLVYLFWGMPTVDVDLAESRCWSLLISFRSLEPHGLKIFLWELGFLLNSLPSSFAEPFVFWTSSAIFCTDDLLHIGLIGVMNSRFVKINSPLAIE